MTELSTYKAELEHNLLGEDTTHKYTDSAKSMLEGKTVLVTGAGGSVGSELVKQLHKIENIKNIICVDRDEYNLYNLELKLKGTALLTDEELVLGDISSYRSIKNIIQKFKPEIIFHAAAVKHLPLLEKSPDIAVSTNVMGTENVVRAAVECGVERLVNVSTDKAANPTSILGYTKRLAEIIAKSYNNGSTNISSVRFGNVFASRGSFIETLQRQINENRPVTITDKRMARYFMSIPQAAGLVIEAGALEGSGNTYVLDMGKPFLIVDVLNEYKKLVGKMDLEITYSGAREGEKLAEILFDDRENNQSTKHQKISKISVEDCDDEFIETIHQLYRDIEENKISDLEIKKKVEILANKYE